MKSEIILHHFQTTTNDSLKRVFYLTLHSIRYGWNGYAESSEHCSWFPIKQKPITHVSGCRAHPPSHSYQYYTATRHCNALSISSCLFAFFPLNNAFRLGEKKRHFNILFSKIGQCRGPHQLRREIRRPMTSWSGLSPKAGRQWSWRILSSRMV
jgi:hypothetical protein